MMKKIITFIGMIIFPISASAQFTKPIAPSAGNSYKKPKAPTTLIEQQRMWVIEATRNEIAKIQRLPRTSGVNVEIQRAITSYAPSSNINNGVLSSSDCQNHIRNAEQKFNLPPYLLTAIALTESGMKGKPSPYALNVSGKSYYPSNESEMREIIAKNGGAAASIDVGCMQVNLKWHAGRFKNWESLLVPRYNTEYAALYLTELHKKYGNWNSAVGAYHSRTPWRSENYACIVSRRWEQLFGSQRDGCGVSINYMADYMYKNYS